MTDVENEDKAKAARQKVNDAFAELGEFLSETYGYGSWASPAGGYLFYFSSNESARKYLEDSGYEMGESYIEDMIEEVAKGEWVSSYAFD